MGHLRLLSILAVAGALVIAARPYAAQTPAATASPTINQFMGAPSGLEVVAAKKADRIAWIAYEKGMRNVYAASAPAFALCRSMRIGSVLVPRSTSHASIGLMIAPSAFCTKRSHSM